MHFAMRTYFIGGIFPANIARSTRIPNTYKGPIFIKTSMETGISCFHFVMKLGTSQCDFLHVRLNTDSCLRKLVPIFIVNSHPHQLF